MGDAAARVLAGKGGGCPVSFFLKNRIGGWFPTMKPFHFPKRLFFFWMCLFFCEIKEFKRSYEPLLLKWDGDDYKHGLKWW